MIVRGVERSILDDALELANQDFRDNIVLSQVVSLSQVGTCWLVRLSVKDLEMLGARRGWPTLQNFYTRQRIRAACFHAVGAYILGVLERVPEATIRTALATYQGIADFGQKCGGVGETNLGRGLMPYRLRDACVCSELVNDPQGLIPYNTSLAENWNVSGTVPHR
jgi:hypothetical protein